MEQYTKVNLHYQQNPTRWSQDENIEVGIQSESDFLIHVLMDPLENHYHQRATAGGVLTRKKPLCSNLVENSNTLIKFSEKINQSLSV